MNFSDSCIFALVIFFFASKFYNFKPQLCAIICLPILTLQQCSHQWFHRCCGRTIVMRPHETTFVPIPPQGFDYESEPHAHNFICVINNDHTLRRVALYRSGSHHITSHRIASHHITSHRIASHHIINHVIMMMIIIMIVIMIMTMTMAMTMMTMTIMTIAIAITITIIIMLMSNRWCLRCDMIRCKGNILTLWEWLNYKKQFFVFKFNCIIRHLYLAKNFKHFKLKLTRAIFSPNVHWWANQAHSWLLSTLTFNIIWSYQFIRQRFPSHYILQT